MAFARPILLALVLLLAMPQAAAAQNVPPGNSEADQYSETIPDGTGNGPIGGDDTAPEDVLSDDQIDQLNELGDDGAAAASLAAATAPGGSSKGPDGGDGGDGGGPDGAGVGGDGGGLGDSVPSATTNSGVPTKDGLGGLLWVIIIGSAVAAAGYAGAKWRSRRSA